MDSTVPYLFSVRNMFCDFSLNYSVIANEFNRLEIPVFI